MGSECLSARLKFGVEFQSVVLMPNHFHMLVTTPEQDLGIVMRDFMANITREANRLSGRTGHVFGGPYYWSLINSSRYYGHAFKYVYQNPVRARLCAKVEDYPFSTLHGLLGHARLPFPISCPRPEYFFAIPGVEPSDFLGWLNKPFPKETELLIKKGLRKKVFDKMLCRKTRTEYPELMNLT
jgi:putative transposase